MPSLTSAARRFGAWAAMFRSRKVHPAEVRIALSIDGEGVVRVVNSTSETVTLTCHELGQLLTGLVKAVCGTEDGEETIDVSLN